MSGQSKAIEVRFHCSRFTERNHMPGQFVYGLITASAELSNCNRNQRQQHRLKCLLIDSLQTRFANFRSHNFCNWRRQLVFPSMIVHFPGVGNMEFDCSATSAAKKANFLDVVHVQRLTVETHSRNLTYIQVWFTQRSWGQGWPAVQLRACLPESTVKISLPVFGETR